MKKSENEEVKKSSFFFRRYFKFRKTFLWMHKEVTNQNTKGDFQKHNEKSSRKMRLRTKELQ